MVTPIPWCNWTFLDQPFTSNGMIHGVIFHFATLLFRPLTAWSCCIFWNKITHWGKSFCTAGSLLQNGLGHYVHVEDSRSLMTLMGYSNGAVNQPPALRTQTVNLKCIPFQQNVNVKRWETQTLGENDFSFLHQAADAELFAPVAGAYEGLQVLLRLFKKNVVSGVKCSV